MAKVKKLKIAFQTGSSNEHFATWEFDSGKSASSSSGSGGSVKVGSWVKVKAGSKWYNGVSVASFVFNDTWKVVQVNGNRVVLGRNKSGTNDIESPIHKNNLTVVSAKSAGATTYADSVSYLDHYSVYWYYDTGNGVWFSGSNEDTKRTNSTYSPPENARRIKVSVKPVSKTHKVNKKDVSYWSGTWVSATYNTSSNPPEVPPTPTFEYDNKTKSVTTIVDNVSDPRTDAIQFDIYDMKTKRHRAAEVNVVACRASFSFGVDYGSQHRIRAAAINKVGSSRIYSDYTDYTEIIKTAPDSPGESLTARATSSTSIRLHWSEVNTADTYEVEYTTRVDYFDASGETTSITGVELNRYEVTGLETGDEYFFRVRAVNEIGESPWSSIVSVTIGKDPAAPTTWSSSTTVIVGKPLNLYWVHNAKDGSTETYAEVEIRIGDDIQVYTVKNELANEEENEDKDKTKHYEVDTSQYPEGTQLKWRVRTAGITMSYGEWSVQRTVDIYAQPTLSLDLKDQNGDSITTLTSFPMFIDGLTGPKTQAPIGYSVTITAQEGYETVDSIGEPKIVNSGDVVYSVFVDTDNPLLVELSASNVSFENNITYLVTAIASMNSGLTATETKEFDVSWADDVYDVDAEVGVDEGSYSTYVTPYCYPIVPETEEEDPDAPYEPPTQVGGVLLAVYRREFDGTFKEIASGLKSEDNTVVVDPHPALDYARYRIVAMSEATGTISYYDAPGYPIQCKSIIIQWSEEWSEFDATDDDEELAISPWTGSFLKLPYNIDVSDDSTPEVSLVNYIGRTYPVSYYGTAVDSTATWNVDVPSYDIDTLYALRRLAIWKGDAYVREPSGSGYWANINVSFSQKHTELVIPVTLSLTRVEGGI